MGLVAALWHLLMGPGPEVLSFTLGLPGVGANFRLDALASFFLVIVNFGGAAASLYAIGYGRHEASPLRVLPFFPAYLAGMNLVVLADDAFSFLVAWEFMSLSSWALVMANHRAPENARAGFVYLVMASFGTLALLLAFGLLAGPDGGYAFASMRGHHPDSVTGALVLLLALVGAGSKAGPRAAPCLAAAGASGGAEPCLGADERSDDQGRHLRLHSHRVRSGRRAGVVDEPDRAGIGGRDRGDRHSLGADAERSEASVGLFHRRECRHHLYRPWAGAGVSRQSHGAAGGARDDCSAVSCAQSFDLQEPAVLRRRCGAHARPANATWSASAASSIACRGPLPHSSSAARRSRRCRRSTASCRNG